MYCDLDGRPSFASEDRRTFNSGSSPAGSRNLAPSIKSPIANSFMSEQFRDGRVSQLSASSFGINLGLGSGEVYRGSSSKRPVSANLSVCESMTTNGRRRSSSLVMLPNRNPGKKGGSSVSSTGGRGKENTELGGRDQDRRSKAIKDQERGMEGDDSDEEEDDGDESDDEGTQNYYVYEAASLITDSDDGGERNSVLILMPIPEGEQKMMRQREAEENDLTSRWSAVSDDLTPRSSIWGTAPLPPSSPLPPYSPEMSPSPIQGHLPSLFRSALPPKPKRPPPAPPTSNRQEQPQEAPTTTDPVVFSWSKATQTTTAVPVPVPSPALTPKTLSAPPPPKKTIPAAGLGGYVPLPPPPPPRKPSSCPRPPVGRSRSLKYQAGASNAFASSDTSVGNPNNPGLIRVRSASTRTSTPPPRSERVIPLSSHVKLSSDVVRTIPPPTTTHRKHRSTSSQRLPTPSTPSNSHSRKERSGYTRGDDSQRVSGGDDWVRMAKNDEFIRSSGRAFQGQSFRAIQVLDEYSGAMEVHVGKGVKVGYDLMS
ncbi:hypothetical protein FRB97_004865 [Tulasnella sp. 331]|nr:hypothetical protein FRB97_004865 [Tulasnella sp. 331]